MKSKMDINFCREAIFYNEKKKINQYCPINMFFELLKAVILLRPHGTFMIMGLPFVTTNILSLTGQSQRDKILVVRISHFIHKVP
jgi:hypothetical protein